MARRNRTNRTPQRGKGFPVRVERVIAQLLDDAVEAVVYMATPRDPR